jgi:hypothetical protein
MTGVLPWLIRWARRASTIDFYPALAALVSPVQIIVSPHCPEPGQAVVMGRLSHALRRLSTTVTVCITSQLLPVPVYIAFF